MADDQFPVPWTWPENVQFTVHNVLWPISANLRCDFDVVHLRLLAGALTPPDIDTALGNIFEMLSESA